MNQQQIIGEIENFVQGAYAGKKIGITGDPARKWRESGKPATWRHFDADNEEVAKLVQKYFSEKGCESDECSTGNVPFVFIF